MYLLAGVEWDEACMCRDTHLEAKGQLERRLSLFTMCMPALELRLSGFVANTLPGKPDHWPENVRF